MPMLGDVSRVPTIEPFMTHRAAHEVLELELGLRRPAVGLASDLHRSLASLRRPTADP